LSILNDMSLSERATRYLEIINKTREPTCTDLDLIKKYMISQGIPAFEKILEFQLYYAGLKFKVANNRSSAFEASLFLKKDIKSHSPINCVVLDGGYYFFCGNHATAQFHFALSEKGRLCTYDEKDKTVTVISSSFTRFIEEYALKDELCKNNKFEMPSYYEITDMPGLNRLMVEFSPYPELGDEYNQWFENNGLIVEIFTWLDRQEKGVHIFADNEKQAIDFVQLLIEKKFIA
jgi:hypothetical protein